MSCGDKIDLQKTGDTFGANPSTPQEQKHSSCNCGCRQ